MGRLETRFASLVRRSTECIIVASAEGTIHYVNPATDRTLGVRTQSELSVLSDLFMPADLAFVREVILTEYGRTGTWSGDFHFRRRSGPVAVPVFLNVFSIAGAEAGRDDMALVARDISGRRRSEARLRLLVDIGAVLAQSLDHVKTLENLAELVVKNALATYCVVDVFSLDQEGHTTIDRACAVHADPERSALLHELARFSPQFEGRPHPIGNVLADGASTLVASVDVDWIARNAVSEEHAASVHRLGVRSLVVVPLMSGGDIVGALSCALADETAPRATLREDYDAEDLFFLEEVGRRAGAALRNAQLYARERRIAMSLQAASLPQALPDVPGAVITAEYRPGSTEATIGGDWYDAFLLDDGRLAISVGDVCGHGLNAAVTMTKLRQAMQSAALIEADPRTMLDAAQRTLRVLGAEAFATALAAIVDVAAKSATFASAGHPAPMVRAPDGSVREYGSGGILLGAGWNGRYELNTLDFDTGSLFCFFTDGLTEATRDVANGYERVRGALHDVASPAQSSAAREFVDAVLAGAAARDDIAVLMVEISGSP